VQVLVAKAQIDDLGASVAGRSARKARRRDRKCRDRRCVPSSSPVERHNHGWINALLRDARPVPLYLLGGRACRGIGSADASLAAPLRLLLERDLIDHAAAREARLANRHGWDARYLRIFTAIRSCFLRPCTTNRRGGAYPRSSDCAGVSTRLVRSMKFGLSIMPKKGHCLSALGRISRSTRPIGRSATREIVLHRNLPKRSLLLFGR